MGAIRDARRDARLEYLAKNVGKVPAEQMCRILKCKIQTLERDVRGLGFATRELHVDLPVVMTTVERLAYCEPWGLSIPVDS